MPEAAFGLENSSDTGTDLCSTEDERSWSYYAVRLQKHASSELIFDDNLSSLETRKTGSQSNYRAALDVS